MRTYVKYLLAGTAMLASYAHLPHDAAAYATVTYAS